MPSDYYLLIAGVNGESQATGMTNNIELDSWSWGGSAPSDVGNKGLSAGKPSFADFTCSFSLDAASFQLVANLSNGTHIANATFSGRKTGGGANPYIYLVITLTNCFVTSFSTGGGSSGTPSASMSISYEQVQYQYYTQDTSSGAVTLAGQSTYNIGQVATS
ncbi:MAG TPA: type VI secretion system tube protein Hcp [Terriglobia bacterium]|nr:type VI secretion system tube protein Hcp [Terriglobia bacterium]